MKSLAELQAIREKTLEKVNLRKEREGARIVVGMATCGIAAGARPVMLKFLEEVQRHGLDDVTVSQTGCIGMCRYEPMVEVYMPGSSDKTTYVNVNPDMVPRIVLDHIVNNRPVEEYTIGAIEKEEGK